MATLLEILDGLDDLMGQNYGLYVDTIVSIWYEVYQNCNSGSQAILEAHVIPAVMEHCQEARFLWPWGAGPQEYLDKIYSSYDSDVLESCFSDTIYRSYEEANAIFIEADEWQWEHERLAPGHAPHSMDSEFMGTRLV